MNLNTTSHCRTRPASARKLWHGRRQERLISEKREVRDSLRRLLQRKSRATPLWNVALVPLLLAGCTRAPSFDIVGSMFPAWLVCLVLGILLTVFVRWLLLRLKIVVLVPILVYPSLAAFFTLLLWLVFFH